MKAMTDTNVEVKVEVSSLVDLALDKTIDNFHNSPFRSNEKLNPTVAKKFHERLPLPQNDTVEALALFVDSDLYWKRACGSSDNVGNVNDHGGCHKRQYIETNIQSILITSTDASLSEEDIAKKLKSFSDFIHTLCLSDIQHQLSLEVVCSNLTNLQHINLKQIVGLRDNLPNPIASLPYLTTLTMTESQIDDGVELIVTKLADSQTLLYLDLSNNNLTSNGVQHICENLLSSTDACLTHLDLSGNKLESKGAKVIGQTLSNNDSLISLSLRLCMIGDEGGAVLFESLSKNSSLNHINLSANRLGSCSAETLLKVLESKKIEDYALESVVLTSNTISDDDDLMHRLREYKDCFIDVRDI